MSEQPPEQSTTSLDRLFTNIAEMILEEEECLQPETRSLKQARLLKLAESIYIEIVADYQQEPSEYGLELDEDTEDEHCHLTCAMQDQG